MAKPTEPSKPPDEQPPPDTSPPDNSAFLAWLAKVPDPEQRYTIATLTLEEYQDMVSQLSELRAGAVAAAAQDDSVSGVARRFGVSRQRAHQLIQEAQARTTRPSGPRKEKNP